MPPESGEEEEDADFFFFSGVGGVRGSRSGIFDGMECTTIIVCWTRSTSFGWVFCPNVCSFWFLQVIKERMRKEEGVSIVFL